MEGKAPGPESAYTQLLASGTDGLDGLALQTKRRDNRLKFFLFLLSVYMVGGQVVFYFLEGWGPLQSLIFLFSILTGVGYGHLVPNTEAAKVLTAVYIIAGLGMFASVMGQILDWVMAAEIEALSQVMGSLGEKEEEKLDYNAKRLKEKRADFLSGLTNACVLYVAAVVAFVAIYKEEPVNAIYLSAISVMKLDSLCLLDSVKCSNGRDTSGGGNRFDTALAICWYLITCGTIGHFMVATANYFGTDPENRMTKVKQFNTDRLKRMDKDGDNKVTRCEFLGDRLISADICTKEQIDNILKNFDELDKDGSGILTLEDIAKIAAQPTPPAGLA